MHHGITRARALMLAAGAMLAMVPATAVAQVAGSEVRYNIPAQELGSALNELARQSNREIYFSAELVRGRRAPQLRGEMRVEEALDALLGGSGLRYRIGATGSIIVEASAVDAADEAAAPEEAAGQELVVTGTLLRGVAPKTSATLALTRDDIEAKGAMSTDQLLRSIPQLTTFNTVSAVGANMDGGGGAGAAISTNFTNQTQRPSLRNLTASGGGGAGATLILIDGHRVAGAGIFNPSPDPDIVSPAVLERVEVVLDGGSALYGSDAVGGVINFITRRRLDGVQAEARYGMTDDYAALNVNAAVGKAWSGGSAYLSYSYAQHDEIRGLDRDYIQAINWVTGVPSGRQCAVGNVSVSTRTYGLPGLLLNNVNACDPTDHQFIVPREERHSVFAGFSQDLNSHVKFDVRLFYTDRETIGNGGPLATSVNVRPTNPFYRPLPAPDATAVQSVQFNYAPVNGNAAATTNTRLKQWGITPSIRIDLPGRWAARAFVNYSESYTEYRNQALNTDLQTAYVNRTTAATALNPYAIASTPNQQLIADVLNWQRYGYAKSELINHKLVFDGPLLALPGGEIRAAIGAEYIGETFKTRSGFTVRNGEASLPFSSYGRHETAIFGELNVPIVGPDNDVPLIESLSLSGSVRRDDYSDFGKTTNPKLGVAYEPFEWLRFRTSWGKAFNAPSPSDQLASLANTLTVSPFALITPPGGPAAPPGSYTIVQFGAVTGLQPQKATSFSYGVDFAPPWVPGLSFTGNIYQVDFRNQLGNPPFFNATEMFANFREFVQLAPTAAQIAAAGASAPGGSAAVAQFLAPGGPTVYAIIDARSRNLGRTKVRGLDFAASYKRDVGFGAIDFGFSGNYQISRKFSNSPGAPLVEVDLDFGNRLRFTANAGATIGRLRAQATLNHLEGYRIARTATVHQDKVSAFNTVDLFLKYDLGKLGLVDNLAITLNVNNLLNQDPPTLRSDGSTGITNGSTLGRLFQLGVSTRF